MLQCVFCAIVMGVSFNVLSVCGVACVGCLIECGVCARLNVVCENWVPTCPVVWRAMCDVCGCELRVVCIGWLSTLFYVSLCGLCVMCSLLCVACV